MSQTDAARIRKYALKMNSDREKEEESISKITDREVRELYENDAIENVKGGIYELFVADYTSFYSFTGFSVEDFEKLHDIVGDVLEHHGKGRNPRFGSKDLLLVLLYYFRRYPKFETIRLIFHLPESTFKGLLKNYIPKLLERLENKFLVELIQNCEIEADEYFTECCYIVDATVQPIDTPQCSFETKEPWFSGKHGVYGLKSQVITSLKGLAMHITTGIKAGVHDKTVFEDSIDDFRKKVLQFHLDKPMKILGDKGYQDQTSDILVTPFKGDIFDLSDEELEFNENMRTKRVIIENFFGRLKNRYQITKDSYRGDHCYYSSFFIICCCLVNFEITICGSPLRNSDSQYYTKLMTKMIKDSIQNKTRNAKNIKNTKEDEKKKF